MKKILLLIMIWSAVMNVLSAHAESTPRSLSTDRRVKIVMYDPNNVVILQSKYGYQTQIVFSQNENIQNVSVGDSIAWQAKPAANNLFIKPLASSKTNMTVLTNIGSYNFQLDSTIPNAIPTYRLQFIYPDGGYDQAGNANSVGTFDPDKLNWKYSFTGDKALVPEEVFDNGQFTYFRFKKNGLSKTPALFMVDKYRNETLVNYHMQGDYLVVNGVSKQFTLRNGDYITTVYNDDAIGDWKKI